MNGRCLTRLTFGVLRNFPPQIPKLALAQLASQEQTKMTHTISLTLGFQGKGQDRLSREGAPPLSTAARDLD